MNQSEIDMFFWDQVADDWAELAAKPIIMSEPTNHPSVRGAVKMMERHGRISDGVRTFVQRKLAIWGLEPHEANEVIDMQLACSPELTVTNSRDGSNE